MSAEIGRLQAGDAARAIRIPAGSVTLDGELSVPPDPQGLVIFAHGSGSSRHSPRNQFVARQIQLGGIGTLLFDLLTPAEERKDASTGYWRYDIELLTHRLRPGPQPR